MKFFKLYRESKIKIIMKSKWVIFNYVLFWGFKLIVRGFILWKFLYLVLDVFCRNGCYFFSFIEWLDMVEIEFCVGVIKVYDIYII